MTGRTIHPRGLQMRIEGPWPFVTHRSYVVGGRRSEWLAREHRKGLRFATAPFGQNSRYN